MHVKSELRRLTAEEAAGIKSEIPNVVPLMVNHYMGNKAYATWPLNEGASVWIHHATKDQTIAYQEELPKTIAIVKKIAHEIEPNPIFGRIYLHLLPTGKKIFKHVDIEEYFYQTRRYQIYLDIPEGMEIVHSGDPINPDSVIFFDPIQPHAYYNRSQSDVFFIVFDLFKHS